MTANLGPLDYSKTSVDALAKWAQQGEPKRTSSHANQARLGAAGRGWARRGEARRGEGF